MESHGGSVGRHGERGHSVSARRALWQGGLGTEFPPRDSGGGAGAASPTAQADLDTALGGGGVLQPRGGGGGQSPPLPVAVTAANSVRRAHDPSMQVMQGAHRGAALLQPPSRGASRGASWGHGGVNGVCRYQGGCSCGWALCPPEGQCERRLRRQGEGGEVQQGRGRRCCHMDAHRAWSRAMGGLPRRAPSPTASVLPPCRDTPGARGRIG